MNYSWLFIGMALLAGAVLPLQAGLNVQMGKSLGHPILAAFATTVVGAFCLLLIAFLAKVPIQGITGGFRTVGAWQWMSGVLGAFFVTAAAVLAPKMGTAVTFSLIISGQLLISVLLDHFGLLGIQVHQVNMWRIVGVLLLVAGVILIQRY